MPTMEYRKIVVPCRIETVVSTGKKGWQGEAVRLMGRRERFILETASPSFDPSDRDAAALWIWLHGSGSEISGCSLPGALGLILVGCAALSPERLSRTGLAALGAFCLTVVGQLVVRFLIAAHTYRWRVAFNTERGKYSWLAEPCE